MPSHIASPPRKGTRSKAAGRAARSTTTLLYGGAEASPKVTWVALTNIGRSLCHDPSIEGDATAWRCGRGSGAGAKASGDRVSTSGNAIRRTAEAPGGASG